MINWIKWSVAGVVSIAVLAVGAVYFSLWLSLPTLDGNSTTKNVDAHTQLSRDAMGHAVINAATKLDAAYALGFAHGQDRLFQMDLLRRSASGALSEWVGDIALKRDKSIRFHQFSTRAKQVFEALPLWQKQLLIRYSHGVNAAIDEYNIPPFEYIVTGVALKRWKPTDSILVAYSMYLDLQGSQLNLDLARTLLKEKYGEAIYDFVTQPSNYQAALDGSVIEYQVNDIPEYPPSLSSLENVAYNATELPDIGSNNWAVSGNLTPTGHGMLANDMHLGLRVPNIWYRAQLNYKESNEAVSMTGVSLPGLPSIVVGTNDHVAWGFTNANLDNVDWIALPENAPTTTEEEHIVSSNGASHVYPIVKSEYGPVREINGKRYALNWVAHHPFAVNLSIVNMGTVKSVEEGITVGRTIAIPTQNMVMADKKGSIAWLPAGAIMHREIASNVALSEQQFAAQGVKPAENLPLVLNPDNDRIWTANSRVIAANDLAKLGNGGYALGARGLQIKARLFERGQFTENDFYAIQLDNNAQFLTPWHTLLTGLLASQRIEFKPDISYLNTWGACACESSVGYTLVKAFRRHVIQHLFGQILSEIDNDGVDSRGLLRGIEPAVWQLIHTQPSSWLKQQHSSFDALLVDAYRSAKNELLDRFSPVDGDLTELAWGKVNALTVKHPFSSQIPLVGDALNMRTVDGFGDTYMPAVQAPKFGASQRFFARPGKLDEAVLTLPSGQSGHPLSDYFSKGFEDYATHGATPLLPGTIEHSRHWYPNSKPIR